MWGGVECSAWMQISTSAHLWHLQPVFSEQRQIKSPPRPLWRDGETKPAGSSGVKTSCWFSDVSQGQICLSCRRFIRQLIKEDTSMEGDSTVASERAESEIGEMRTLMPYGMKIVTCWRHSNKARLEVYRSKALAWGWSIMCPTWQIKFANSLQKMLNLG